MSRCRINVVAGVPDRGASAVSASVSVVWDNGADPADVEQAIHEAARRAVIRYKATAGLHTATILPFPES